LPFSKKYKKSMGFPKEGDTVNGFTVQSVSVKHIAAYSGKQPLYEYPTEITVKGKGNINDVRKAFRSLFDSKKTIFSGYGNPYQCLPGKMQIQSLGNGRFLISARGTCVRIYLRNELVKFMKYLSEKCYLAEEMEDINWKQLIEDYLRNYC